MTSKSDAPVDLYIAAYSDPTVAQSDWDNIKELSEEGTITVEGLVLVSRGTDGKIDVKDNAHTVAHGAGWGAAAGLLVGLIFPPAFLASGVVGGAIGAGAGGLLSHGRKEDIKDEVADDLPIPSSGIVALFEEHYATDVKKALPKADKVSKHEVDKKSAEQAKDMATSKA